MGTPRTSGAPSTRRSLLATTALCAATSLMFASVASHAEDGGASTAAAEPAQVAPAQVAVVTPAGHVVYLRGTASDDYGVARVGGGWTIRNTTDSSLSLWADAYDVNAFDSGRADFTAGSIGVAYRKRLNERDIWGVHAFIDAGEVDGGDDTLAQVSFGGDVERLLAEERRQTLRVGGNVYVPLDDYTDVAEYGLLDRAPQLGADAFVRYARDTRAEGVRLALTAGAFDYLGRSQSSGLMGAFGSAGLSYARAPQGLELSGEVGLRYANGGDGLLNRDEEISPFASVQLSYSWGGSRITTERVSVQPDMDPRRDCVVERDGAGEPQFDCAQPVIADGAGARTKENAPAPEPLPEPEPRIVSRTLVTQGLRPTTPMRHLGFNAPFAPIRRPRTFEPEVAPPPPPPPPVVEPPAEEPPATEPPAEEPPATEPPAEEPPATEPPAEEPPATEPPAEEPPAEEPPAPPPPPPPPPPAEEPPAEEPPAEEPPVDHDPDCDIPGHHHGKHGKSHRPHGDHRSDRDDHGRDHHDEHRRIGRPHAQGGHHGDQHGDWRGGKHGGEDHDDDPHEDGHPFLRGPI